jgi:hypothetical protein
LALAIASGSASAASTSRIPLPGRRLQRLDALIVAVIARHHRHAGRFHQRFGGRFRAHQVDGRGGRSDENEPGVRASLREVGILGKESVARMGGTGAGGLRRLDDGFDVQIAVLRRRRADEHGLVGERHVHGITVGVGEHRHRSQAHALGGAHDPAGDLAAVGDQQLVEGPSGRHITS